MAKYFLHYYYYSLVYSLYYRLVPDKRGGAIAVLFLFVIMLINIRLTDIIETGRQYTKNIPLALGISLLFIYEFLTIMPFSFNNVSILSYLLNLINNLNSLILTSNADISSYNVVYNTINTATNQKLVVSPSGTKKLDTYFVTGLTDAEWCFSFSIIKSD